MTAVPNLPLRPLTLQDVTALAEADGQQHRFELTEGNLIVMPPGTWGHQKISARLHVWLDRRFGERVGATPGVKTSNDDLNGRIPDLVVIKGDVRPDTVWMPAESVLLAVEIVSPGSERTDRWLKPVEYAEAGIMHFWRVEPDDIVLRFQLVDGVYKEVDKQPLDALLAGEVPDLS